MLFVYIINTVLEHYNFEVIDMPIPIVPEVMDMPPFSQNAAVSDIPMVQYMPPGSYDAAFNTIPMVQDMPPGSYNVAVSDIPMVQDMPPGSYDVAVSDIPMVSDMLQIPIPPTHDTFDLHKQLQRGETVPCTHCANPCPIKLCIMENNNPCHPPGASVSYCIPFCCSKCQKYFIHRCKETTPFPVDKDFVFGFHSDSGGPERDWWTMFSIIPEGGKWVICQCTDEGELLLDEKDRPIWTLVSDAVLRRAIRVYN
jgi:hypothetical protein